MPSSESFTFLPMGSSQSLPFAAGITAPPTVMPGVPGSAGILRASSCPATTFSMRLMSLKSILPSFSRRVTASRSTRKWYSMRASAPSCARVPSATRRGLP